MNLLARYEGAIEKKIIIDDPSQREILVRMQMLVDEIDNSNKPRWRWWSRKSIKGLYIYGSVGVGKTYLVDLFYSQVQESKKARYHFHHFMQQIDIQLRRLQGKKDPLRLIAKNIAQSIRLLCFDEFLVNDVAYAMILAQLLEALMQQGVVLVISSNTQPNDLYLNGVHRERFLPAIALLNTHCDILHLNKQKDYRVGRAPLLNAYIQPLNDVTHDVMIKQFNSLAPHAQEGGVIKVQTREIPYIKCGLKAIWFAFDVMCNLPRSQLDYLEIAQRYDVIFISDIPQLTEHHTAQTIMFIYFIDVMYDRGINIIISAAVPVEQLYVQGEMKETFKRTLSRLIEMQSVDYLSRHPRRMDCDLA